MQSKTQSNGQIENNNHKLEMPKNGNFQSGQNRVEIYTLMILATIRIQRDRFEAEWWPESSPVTKKPKWVKTASMAFFGDTGGGSKWRGAAELRGSLAKAHRLVGVADGGRRRSCGGAAERDPREEREREFPGERERRRKGIG
ncbi:hypothetical protein PanWU01x14_371640 [Parasponia andersonii]|uniref:Uncharacterized protein n=1 Tax=Parasponia andersonii TaxID=3476 RepID=A0A2P5A3S2_PARAD|nr:hypothetical protein PanWU01x14_371640 [Parasponia andersonii]